VTGAIRKSKSELRRHFRRLWLVALGAAALGTVTVFIAGGPRAGAVLLVLTIGIAVSGAVALAVMRRTGRT
jgi:hypothetical protein